MLVPVFHDLAERFSKRGVVMVLSDLFDEPSKLVAGLKHFRHRQHDVIVFHVLDPQEIVFDYQKNTKFVDLENAETLITEPRKFQEAYQKTMKDFIVNHLLLIK